MVDTLPTMTPEEWLQKMGQYTLHYVLSSATDRIGHDLAAYEPGHPDGRRKHLLPRQPNRQRQNWMTPGTTFRNRCNGFPWTGARQPCLCNPTWLIALTIAASRFHTDTVRDDRPNAYRVRAGSLPGPGD